MNYQQAGAPPPKSGWPAWVVVLVAVLVAVVAIVGVLGVLAIYGVRKYVATAKTAEARATIGQIAKDATVAFARDGKLCPSASSPVPATVPRGVKYMSTAADWQKDKPTDAGFACLRFEMSSPQYYQYSYTATATSFTATAHGDLDGDGSPSTFEIEGRVSGGTLLVSPTIKEIDPFE